MKIKGLTKKSRHSSEVEPYSSKHTKTNLWEYLQIHVYLNQIKLAYFQKLSAALWFK